MIDFEFDFRYEGEKIPALKNVQGEIGNGKCIVLCGGSGCGKSTLLRCINHLIPQFYEGNLKGFCRIQGRDTGELSVGEVGRLAASVFQDPRSQFFTINSTTEVAFGMENHGVPREEMVEKVEAAFGLFSLEKLKDRNVYELSSGERQLISILSAWAVDTDVLLLDEPTANLDFAAIKQLRELLLKLKGQGKTLILSEHRLYYLSGIADEYWLMEGGRLKGCYPEEGIKAIQKEGAVPLRTFALEDIAFSAKPPTETQVSVPFSLSAEGLHFGYWRKGDELLHGVSFTAGCGETAGIIGPNGSGKTTMGKIIAGLLCPSAGDIFMDGKKMKSRDLQKNALFVMQESEFQFYTNSVMNELRYGHKDTPGFQEDVERLLKKVGMWECRNRHPFALSGGQMQKLSLMIAYFSPKRIVILDEPTAGLDAGSLKSCAELIREMRKTKLVFVITHDIELIAQACTRCICIADGKTDREISLTGDAQLMELVGYMEENFRMDVNAPTEKPAGRKCRLHPAVKLMFWLAAMAAVSLSNSPLLVSVYAALVLMLFVDGWAALAFAGTGVLAVLSGTSSLLSNTPVYFFAAVLLPRALAVPLATWPLIGRDEASRTLACFRAVHMPEKLIMICSVVFRFFPVLSGDMKLMRQSVKTRGVYSTLGQKLRALPEYLEILTVPMALRVIRIAETLSASAETRGIALGGKRSTYVRLSFHFCDFIFIFLLAAALVIGFLR